MPGYTLLLKIALPSGDVFMSDGGVTAWDGDTYTPSDATLGSLSGVGTLNEGGGSQIPALQLNFAAPDKGAVTALSNGAIQQSRVEMRVATYDEMTGAVIGTPDLRFVGMIDQPTISAAFRELSVGLTVVNEMEFLFEAPNGNELSAAFHKSLYSGETGHDNATGLGVSVAWGAESPPTTSSYTSSGGSGGGGTTRQLHEY